MSQAVRPEQAEFAKRLSNPRQIANPGLHADEMVAHHLGQLRGAGAPGTARKIGQPAAFTDGSHSISHPHPHDRLRERFRVAQSGPPPVAFTR